MRAALSLVPSLTALATAGCAQIFGFEDPVPAGDPVTSATGAAQGGAGGETTGTQGGGGSSASSGAQGGSGGGAAMVCTPDSEADCYDGPPETIGRGACSMGTHVCNADGSAYGPCLGQSLPHPEDCSSNEDENCDGASGCTGAHLWSKRFGGGGDERGQGIAADVAGSVFVTGDYGGSLDFGGGTLQSAAGNDLYLAKLASDGAYLWANSFGGAGDQYSRPLALDPLGNPTIGESFEQMLDLGGSAPLASASGRDLYLGRFASADGGHLWSAAYPAGAPEFRSLAYSATGELAVIGWFDGSADLGGGELTGGGGDDIVIGRFGATGAYQWGKAFGDVANQYGHAIAVDSDGNLVVCGTFDGSVDFGCPSGALTAAGGSDVFVAKLDPTGTCVWQRHVTATSISSCFDIATYGTSMVIAGRFAGTITLDSGALVAAGGTDAFVAGLGQDGTGVWGVRLGGTGLDLAQDVAVDELGYAVVLGMFQGTSDSPLGTNLVSAGSEDLFLLKLDGGGDGVWVKAFGNGSDNGDLSSDGVALDPGSNIYLTADIEGGDIDFGGGPLPGAGQDDVVVVKLAP